ncbi:hypothetical protein HD598_002513 [Neomicrococcus aestuarii]|uniref:Uncharacterized protein n=1 Tax=Neomicrococcus aestuarii TaxID=556325 RepID=A0A7W8TYG9_9MICC|nr:DUF6421 family protein [Neomicrococcus aestuarii]MBB5513826.1 hypothetical protein [Neomicrococcus aestuarii]
MSAGIVEQHVTGADHTSWTTHPAWISLKAATEELQRLQDRSGAVPLAEHHARAGELVATMAASIAELTPLLDHDRAYLEALVSDLHQWVQQGFGVPDFLNSLLQFQPQQQRVNGLVHLVLFPMYTQNGSTDRHFEAVLASVIWPEFIADLEATTYTNALFVPLQFIDFTSGYDTNSAVLFPESVSMREIPTFTWGAIFQDREAARYRKVVKAAASITRLELPAEAQELLENQDLATETFVLWDLIHDRSHMRGDLPFDPFMIKQRMPYFLYSLEELRCDLTAFRECTVIAAKEEATDEVRKRARLAQYAIIFDRIFRFALTGKRVRNYDAVGGQLLFAWMHQHGVLHWTDTTLDFDWANVPEVINALGERINDLYWRSIDRPKMVHWLAAYELISETLAPHPASVWAKGADALPLTGAPGLMTDQVLTDEFPLSMFYEALSKKLTGVIESTVGMTGSSSVDHAV